MQLNENVYLTPVHVCVSSGCCSLLAHPGGCIDFYICQIEFLPL